MTKKELYNWDALFLDYDLKYKPQHPFSNEYILSKDREEIKIDTYSYSLRVVRGENIWLEKMSKDTFYSLCGYVQKRYRNKEENEVEERLKELGVIEDE